MVGWRMEAVCRLCLEGFPMLPRSLVLATVAAMAILPMPLAAQTPAAQTDLSASVERQLPALTETYKHLHRNPELSRHEERTAALR